MIHTAIRLARRPVALTIALPMALAAAGSAWAGAPAAAPADDGHPAGYALVFADEFDGTTLDRTRWCTRFQYGGGPAPQVPDPACGQAGRGTLDHLGGGTPQPEQQRYVDFNALGRPMHQVHDGLLRLMATRSRDDRAAPYEAGLIRSKQLFRPGAGLRYYMVARVRLPRMRGAWPAFWLAPGIGPDGKTGWPPEIDILEAPLNDKWDTADMVIQNVQGQKWGADGVDASGVAYTQASPNYAKGKLRAQRDLRGPWLLAAVEWTDAQACFSLDGVRSACAAYEWKHNDGQPAPAATLLLNFAVGGWAGRNGIDDGALPASFDIDFVRVYASGTAVAPAPAPPPATARPTP